MSAAAVETIQRTPGGGVSVQAGTVASSSPTPPVPEPVAFNFTQSESFAPLLKQLGVSLLVTTYQANKLLVLREQSGGLSILVRSFERPMGLAVDARRIALGTRDQVWQFRNAPDLAPQVEPPRRARRLLHPPHQPRHRRHRRARGRVGRRASSTSCGSSTRASPACARCTPTTASSRAGGRRSSPPWRRKTAATSTAWRSSTGSRAT